MTELRRIKAINTAGIKPFELVIDTLWGEGYIMPEHSRIKLQNWDQPEAQAA